METPWKDTGRRRGEICKIMSMVHINGPRVYRYWGRLFEISHYGGPWPLKSDGAPYKRASWLFWRIINRFEKMPKDKQEKYRIGGGCYTMRSGGSNVRD